MLPSSFIGRPPSLPLNRSPLPSAPKATSPSLLVVVFSHSAAFYRESDCLVPVMQPCIALCSKSNKPFTTCHVFPLRAFYRLSGPMKQPSVAICGKSSKLCSSCDVSTLNTLLNRLRLSCPTEWPCMTICSKGNGLLISHVPTLDSPFVRSHNVKSVAICCKIKQLFFVHGLTFKAFLKASDCCISSLCQKVGLHKTCAVY